MVGFEDFCPKTQGWNLATADSILFQFQKFKNLEHDPQFFEPLKQEYLEKVKPQEQKFMSQFWDRISQNQP